MYPPKDYAPFWRIGADGFREFDDEAFWASRSWLDRRKRDYRVRFWPIKDAIRDRVTHVIKAARGVDCHRERGCD
jgi:hypothetical protein